MMGRITGSSGERAGVVARVLLGVMATLFSVVACASQTATLTASAVPLPPATATTEMRPTSTPRQTAGAPAGLTPSPGNPESATVTRAAPTPEAQRIVFSPGTTQTTVEGYLPADVPKVFALGIASGQFVEMSATVDEMGQGLRFSIVGADGTLVKPMGEAHVRAVLPSTQDYYVELASDVGATSYRMSVLIPVRVTFEAGDTSAEVQGSLAPGEGRHYVLRASEGQRLIVVEHVAYGHMRLIISGADGQVLLSGRVAGSGFDGILPATQDYLISVQGDSAEGADYALEITVPSV